MGAVRVGEPESLGGGGPGGCRAPPRRAGLRLRGAGDHALLLLLVVVADVADVEGGAAVLAGADLDRLPVLVVGVLHAECAARFSLLVQRVDRWRVTGVVEGPVDPGVLDARGERRGLFEDAVL